MVQWVEKKYAMNNTIIYIDGGYPSSFHDLNILQHLGVYKDWRNYFTHRYEYFECLLGDLGYMG
jgi:hypothetical protein